MSAQTHQANQAPAPASNLAGARVTFPRVLRSEWRKLFSLRATWIMFSIGVVLVLGFAAIGGWGVSTIGSYDPMTGEPVDSSTFEIPASIVTQAATSGFLFGALLIAVAFIVNLAGEYNQHTIVSTLSAVPTRTPVYAAKALIAAVLSFAFGMLLHLASMGITVLILKGADARYGEVKNLWADAAVSGLYVAILALLSVGIAALVRNTAGAIVIMIALVFLLGMVLSILSSLMTNVDAWTWLSQHLPLEAVSALRPGYAESQAQMSAMGMNSNSLASWDAWLTTAFWGLVPLVLGWLSFKTRPVK